MRSIGDSLGRISNGGRGCMGEFRLYIGNKCFSSWSLRPWVAMEQCGIPFEETTIRLRTPETASNLAKVSPTGTVPVLVHGKMLVWETLAILEYLADLFPEKRLWPEEREARALARCVATEMHSGFLELRYGWPMNLRRPKGRKELEGAGAAHEQRIKAIWRQCRAINGQRRAVPVRAFHRRRRHVCAGGHQIRYLWREAGPGYQILCGRNPGDSRDEEMVC